jgi:hypothetical protein
MERKYRGCRFHRIAVGIAAPCPAVPAWIPFRSSSRLIGPAPRPGPSARVPQHVMRCGGEGGFVAFSTEDFGACAGSDGRHSDAGMGGSESGGREDARRSRSASGGLCEPAPSFLGETRMPSGPNRVSGSRCPHPPAGGVGPPAGGSKDDVRARRTETGPRRRR